MRLQRAFTILRLLRTGATVDPVQLSEKLGITRRTVFRDISALRALGFVIEFDNETSCYVLVNSADDGPMVDICADSTSASRASIDAVSVAEPMAKGGVVPQRPARVSVEIEWTPADGNALHATAAQLCESIRLERRIRVRQGGADLFDGEWLTPVELSYTSSGWMLRVVRPDGRQATFRMEELLPWQEVAYDTAMDEHSD